MDAAHSNDTIHIDAGSYAGQVLISNESLTLLGSPGAKAGAQYQGDGLSIVGSERGALLRCVFQKLEGHATAEGLWLTSTADGRTNGERFRVVASAVGRVSGGGGMRSPQTACTKLTSRSERPSFALPTNVDG